MFEARSLGAFGGQVNAAEPANCNITAEIIAVMFQSGWKLRRLLKHISLSIKGA